jgi:hypothetical protein
MKVNEELEGMWKASVLSQYMPGGREENQRKLQAGQLVPRQRFKLVTSQIHV